MTLQSRIAGVLVPILLLAIALVQFLGGTAWTPEWGVNLLGRAGVDAIAASRLVAGASAGSALAIMALAGCGAWPIRLARLATTAVSFAAVAEGAALLAKPPVAGQAQGASALIWSAITLAGALALLIALDRSGRNQEPPAGSLTARRATGAAVLFLVALGIAGRVPLQDTIRLEQLSGQGYQPVELDVENWVGLRIPETPIKEHLPRLTAETLEGVTFVVFYNPSCSHCQQLFLEHLHADRPERIIAIAVPPAAKEVMAAGDGADVLDCDYCTKLELPAGPMWLVQIPTVVRVEDGVVTCVATEGFEACIDPVSPAPAN